ncbi:ubiquitin carboxyl-terminal hydrolase 24-like isoform X2 [Dysidea avara]|uniref:ubiquitin carboxyl-terminal hydrolase 24-like isoform X2 n=1 Tax=Dysidea avara TaxID=196820 RepID=UPI00332C1013
MSSPTSQNVELIKQMGLTDDEAIRDALHQAENDVDAALQILLPDTEGNPPSGIDSQSSYERIDSYDIEMKDMETQPSSSPAGSSPLTVSYNVDEAVDDDDSGDFGSTQETKDDEPDDLPPRYDDIVNNRTSGVTVLPSTTMTTIPGKSSVSTGITPVAATPTISATTAQPMRNPEVEFPLTNFYELESRVHTEQWTIPFRQDESLAICLRAATKMLHHDVAYSDEQCISFMERTLPDAFYKLLAHDAVLRWDQTIYEGIHDMCNLLVEMIAVGLRHKPVPIKMLELLTLVFRADCRFHSKNRQRRIDINQWNRLLHDKLFAIMPSYSSGKDPRGWLVDIMNNFAKHNGVEMIIDHILHTDNLTLQELTALFQPFGVCDDYINANYFKVAFKECVLYGIHFVENMPEADMKNKEVGCVSDLLHTLKTLCLHCWSVEDSLKIDKLRLDTTLKMLKTPHFNAKMNALKEVVKLTEEPTMPASRGVKRPIPADKIMKWIIDNKVLSIALGGNLHHPQYCDKIKSIVEFLNIKLSLEELSTIWEMQVDKNPVQVDNIHSILTFAAFRFSAQQVDHLFQLIQQSWESASDHYREKLVDFLGKIGKDDHQGNTAKKILDLLWGLAHTPQLSTAMVELALDAHSAILIESTSARDSEKKAYISKCVEDIKKSVCVVAAFRQLHKLAKGICKSQSMYGPKEHVQIAELQKQHDLLRLTCLSLSRCHTKSVEAAGKDGLSGETMTDGRYKHSECVEAHLKFLAFLLGDGALYLPAKRAIEVWEVLIQNPQACEMDRDLAFRWFDKGIVDLEPDTQTMLFNQKVLKVNPVKLHDAGYRCLRTFFENINLQEKKLKKIGVAQYSLMVESLELTGMDYLWKAALSVKDDKIADELIHNILQVNYHGLNARLKKDTEKLHKKIIDECFHRLEEALQQKPPLATSHKIGTPPEESPPKEQVIERLLLLMQRYVSSVEESHHFPRVHPPHGSCFHGHPVLLLASQEFTKNEFTIQCHSNESLGSVRQKIAKQLNMTPDQVQLGTNDRWLMQTFDNKLLHQLDFQDEQLVIVRTSGVVTSSHGRVDTIQAKLEREEGQQQRAQLAAEFERALPGVMMASERSVFIKLEQLSCMTDSRIVQAVRNLLMLLPTDSKVLEELDRLTQSPPTDGASDDISKGNTQSPTVILQNLFDPSKVPATKLLYHLEVLSSRLMPVHARDSNEVLTQLFRRNFLSAGGLQLVVNVFKRTSLPQDVDIEVRQACYAIAISLARFLLCNQATQPAVHHLSTSFKRALSVQVSEDRDHSTSPPTPPGDEEEVPITDIDSLQELNRNESRNDGDSKQQQDEVARLTIEMMGVDDFTTMLAYLVRVSWAAAAGQLHLASAEESFPATPSKEINVPIGPSTVLSKKLASGICAAQTDVSSKDATIAGEALELLVTCLQLRSSLLNAFYTLPMVKEFIIDVLLGSPNIEVRSAASDQFNRLCKDVNISGGGQTLNTDPSQVKRTKLAPAETPQHFFLHLLLNADIPLWCHKKPHVLQDLRLVGRCLQFFQLKCQILSSLTIQEQERLQVNVERKLDVEIDWLRNVEIEEHSGEEMQMLLAGHLKLVTALFSCEGIEKKKYGKDLCCSLIHQFLFPASTLIVSLVEESQSTEVLDISPRCCYSESRVAAYNLLVVLCDNCLDNLVYVADQLVAMHHAERLKTVKEWEFLPPVIGRPPCGFVGLKNAGATCYMNSVLQQLFMEPTIRDIILSVEQTEEDRENILPDLQTVFGHLQESKLQYYTPDTFWKNFKLYGQPINVREQRDALEFFNDLIDQVDEILKKKSYPQIFMKTFGGTFLDQKICRGCDHRYEREEIFLSLQLPVKSKTLTESLKEFVKGDWLEGDNAYYCEKCEEKRDTLKRMCVKGLPPVLMIHLKRFGFDWEAGRAIKSDDYFEFPWELDMEPYTAAGISQREKSEDDHAATQQPMVYELVGVVVHSGQASAGHYYSFRKSKRFEDDSEEPKWYRFNDTVVDEFVMHDEALAAECFGGSYKSRSNDGMSTNSNYMENKVRFWNAYMLFYTAKDRSRTTAGPIPLIKTPQDKITTGPPISPVSPVIKGDGLSQLTALVQKGEKKGMFSQEMPPQIRRSINEENLQFMQHRDVYCHDYFHFIRSLSFINNHHLKDDTCKGRKEIAVTSLKLAINFLFHTYFHTRKKLRVDRDYWVRYINELVSTVSEACQWLVELLSSDKGPTYLKPLLLDCPNKEVRAAFSQILVTTLHSCYMHQLVAKLESVVIIVDQLLGLLNKEVIESFRTCAEFFNFFHMLCVKEECCRLLVEKDGFIQFLSFLLGPLTCPPGTKQYPHRWNIIQVREFVSIFSVLSNLLRHIDISHHETDHSPNKADDLPNPYSLVDRPDNLLPASRLVEDHLFGADNVFKRLLHECIQVLREADAVITESIANLLCYLCWNSQSHSAITLEELQSSFATLPSNEVKQYLDVLNKMMLMQDTLQIKRLHFTLDGSKYHPQNGIIQVFGNNMGNDHRRAYQAVKFLVNLANTCVPAHQILLNQPQNWWQRTVTWLKRRMSGDTYSWHTSTGYSNDISSSKTLQRTISVQNTLEEATVLLSEFEAQGNHSLHPTNQPATTSSSTVGSSSTIKTDKHINTVDSNTSSNMDDIDG